MHSVEPELEPLPSSGNAAAVWGVRVLLAAALSRALRAGLSGQDIRELLREVTDQGESHV